MTDHLTIEIYRTHASNALAVQIAQLDENGSGWGHRLAGPKHYNMGTTTLLSKELDAEDAKEIREQLDAVFPLTDDDVRRNALTQAIKTVVAARYTTGVDAADVPGLDRAIEALHALRKSDETTAPATA